MAAAAQALFEAGLQPDRIAFLPAHAGEPGSAATEPVRQWWARARRYVFPREELRWGGQTLQQALAAATERLPGVQQPVRAIQDFGGGLWRRRLYPDPAAWPNAYLYFDLPKTRCVLTDGSAVLWKFVGLHTTGEAAGSAAEAAMARQDRLARAGWTVPSLGSAMGFVATPWVEGARLTPADADGAALEWMGRYLAEAAGPPLSPAEAEAAWSRLREMLYWNVWEALDEETAEETRRWADALSPPDGPEPGYGDGRTAPYEWVRSAEGRLLKMDCTGHDLDHTTIGRQPLLWDVAGALVEWGLDAASAAPLLHPIEAALPAPLDLRRLRLYQAAYAAFRTGQAKICAGMSGGDPEEEARLWNAFNQHKSTLARLLSQPA